MTMLPNPLKSAFIAASLLLVAGAAVFPTACAQTERTIVTTTTKSNADFATTRQRLKSAIEARGLTLFNEIDHAAGAASVELTLAPNTLFIFGNPKAGTPLMLANPALGLELPLKANVREENGEVIVTVSDIRAIAARAGVTEAPVLDKMEGALSGILTEATAG